jgi:hypothetical protein
MWNQNSLSERQIIEWSVWHYLFFYWTYVFCVDRYLSFCTFSLYHSIICLSLNEFWFHMWNFQTFLDQFQSHKEETQCYTVGTFPKSNRKTNDATLSEQFQSPIEKQIMSYYRNSSNVPYTVTLELIRECGIIWFSIGLWNCSDSVALFVLIWDFETVLTVWHYLFFYWTYVFCVDRYC